MHCFGLGSVRPEVGQPEVTAHQLIESIFSRVQEGVPGNVRRITQPQFDYLRQLIDADEEGAAVRNGPGGSIVWTPSGRDKYVLAAPLPGRKLGTLTRLSNLAPSGMGSLF